MATKTTAQKAKRKASGAKSKGGSKAGQPVASASAGKIVAQNLVNMVVVMARSGTVLLGLLARQALSDRTLLKSGIVKTKHL